MTQTYAVGLSYAILLSIIGIVIVRLFYGLVKTLANRELQKLMQSPEFLKNKGLQLDNKIKETQLQYHTEQVKYLQLLQKQVQSELGEK